MDPADADRAGVHKVSTEPVCVFLTKQYDGETMECTMGEYVQSFDLLKQRASERELGDVPYLRSWEIAQVHCAVLLVRVSLVRGVSASISSSVGCREAHTQRTQVKPEMLESCSQGFAYFKDMFSILPAGNMATHTAVPAHRC